MSGSDDNHTAEVDVVNNKFHRRAASSATETEGQDEFDFEAHTNNNGLKMGEEEEENKAKKVMDHEDGGSVHTRESSSDLSAHTASPGRSHQSSTAQLTTVDGSDEDAKKNSHNDAKDEEAGEEAHGSEQEETGEEAHGSDQEATPTVDKDDDNGNGPDAVEDTPTTDSSAVPDGEEKVIDEEEDVNTPNQTPHLEQLEETPMTAVSGVSMNNSPQLPPRENHVEAPALPPRKRTPFFWLRGLSSSGSNISMTTSSTNKPRSSSVTSSPDYDLLLHRLNANKEGLQARDESEKDASLTAIKQLQENFEQVKESREKEDEEAIDWEFWSQVVNDYSYVAEHKPSELSHAISSGFPPELRGLIWQLIASSKSASLEEVFTSILHETSPQEKAIKRDLSRTSFIKSANPDSLYRVIKSYSLFDPEVGYTQGMAFITVPLLLNMSESEAFCLLVHLMKDYGLRQLYLPEMPGLHLRLYQFDRILEDTLPDVHIHLARQGVRSSMYASQWFLTLFAYKFPLSLVTRIFDIMIAEGLEALLRFAVALMRKNASTILSLEFDAVLPFLKEKLFDHYLLESGSDPVYCVNDLVSDAYEVKILPVTLRKYENEYAEIHRIERERVEEVESLRSSNGQLTMQVRRLESSLAELNKEHVQVANEMVQGKLEIARLQDENEELKSELTEMKEATKDQSLLADKQLREEMDEIREKNHTLQETKERLENQLNNLEQDLVETKMQLANLDDSYSHLKSRWNELKKHIDDSTS
ncbi:hypothetical protein TRICI_000129 [Trichomonascus ciferrii]|uniref:Rab-GAP TBC domain-containing protein n=1 Tax=Trichomonascus ciferrii TaxID=44093 RepID=A0A642VE78_9ASCO|nr:hypothetical protein TRICI_000129 [Trichomonascus ciferrii]